MISRTLASFACTAALLALSACSTPPTRQQMGIGTGAVVGGVVGNAVSGGGALGTLGGAAVGGVIGNEVTKPHK